MKTALTQEMRALLGEEVKRTLDLDFGMVVGTPGRITFPGVASMPKTKELLSALLAADIPELAGAELKSGTGEWVILVKSVGVALIKALQAYAKEKGYALGTGLRRLSEAKLVTEMRGLLGEASAGASFYAALSKIERDPLKMDELAQNVAFALNAIADEMIQATLGSHPTGVTKVIDRNLVTIPQALHKSPQFNAAKLTALLAAFAKDGDEDPVREEARRLRKLADELTTASKERIAGSNKREGVEDTKPADLQRAKKAYAKLLAARGPIEEMQAALMHVVGGYDALDATEKALAAFDKATATMRGLGLQKA